MNRNILATCSEPIEAAVSRWTRVLLHAYVFRKPIFGSMQQTNL